MTEIDERVRRLLAERFVNLAIADEEGPWAFAAAFVLVDRNLYFYSAVGSRHAKASLSGNRSVAGHLWFATDDEIDGLQFDGHCDPVAEEDLLPVLDAYFTGLFPDPSERAEWERPPEAFVGEGTWRFFRVEIVNAYLIDNEAFERDKVDARIRVTIP